MVLLVGAIAAAGLYFGSHRFLETEEGSEEKLERLSKEIGGYIENEKMSDFQRQEALERLDHAESLVNSGDMEWTVKELESVEEIIDSLEDDES